MWYSINYKQVHEGISDLHLTPSAKERQAMNSNMRAFRQVVYESFRGFVAIAVSLLLIPYSQGLFAQDPQGYPQPQYPQQAPPPGPPAAAYAPLDAQQLNQLVAPIALYPDAMVAQILTASTYPQQIMDASAWMQQVGAGMPPDQRAAAANTMQWDPSVKCLTAYPDVLANLARNTSWAGALGNAYYNQPGDVMNAVQAMRFRAQQAGTLRSTPQYQVVPQGGVIVIQPVNPGYVYVPYYNPWVVYGGPISPWGGYYLAPPPRGVVFAAGLVVGFTAAIVLGAFTHYGWGPHLWEPNWHGGVVVFNHATYISRSTTVINHGSFGAMNRGVFERPGNGVPANFHPAVTAGTAAFHSNPGAFRGSPYNNGARPTGQASPYSRPTGQAAPYSRPAPNAPPASGNQYGRQAPPQQGQATTHTAPNNTERPQMTHETPQSHENQHQGNQQKNNNKKPAPKKNEKEEEHR
jgi:hypothetical protein